MTPSLGAWFLFFQPRRPGHGPHRQVARPPEGHRGHWLRHAGHCGLAMRNAAMGDDDDGVAWWDKIPDEVRSATSSSCCRQARRQVRRCPGRRSGATPRSRWPTATTALPCWPTRRWTCGATPRTRSAAAAGQGHGQGGQRVRRVVDSCSGAGPIVRRPEVGGAGGRAGRPGPIAQPLMNLNSFGRRCTRTIGSANPCRTRRYFPGQAGTLFQRAAEG